MWEPRLPLTAAERQVDFPRLNEAIITARARVEAAAAPSARRLALLLVELYGLPPATALTQLEEALSRSLASTARVGYQEARREIRSLRASQPAVAYTVPDAGRYAQLSRQGLDGVRRLIRERAKAVSAAVAAAAAQAFTTADETAGNVTVSVAAAAAAARALHNHVLELVGETLNLGRSAGALTLRDPPTFSLRSEQLDKRTCGPCTSLHGEITETGSGDYWGLLPPTGCLGGGRCRGMMVFADSIRDVRAPDPTEDELARIRRLPRR